ncbi:hypothetical protein MTR67_002260 [Solanum verrucosum]|uniref:Reverse transcriptase domain-containing protein n=1 Tax=Solanum verrucosum TaxID=315347 RepID=A0AAF0TD53_SOLVR|nr:hypothetical protein MTR67_002260 [Solanum verrucosum]
MNILKMAFMDLMNRVFRQYLDMLVIMFIDDIWIYSKSENEHIDHLRIILQILKDQQLFAKFSKCEFWLKPVAFLGHIVSNKGIEVDSKNTDVVKSWPRPLSASNIRSWLDLSYYYKRFVEVDSTKGGVMVHNGSESSFVSEVKAKQCLDSILVELKEAVLKKSIEAFSQGGDGVVRYQGELCVLNVNDLREQILAESP